MDDKAAARTSLPRHAGAVLALLLGVGCLPFAYLAARSFVETYGLTGDTIQVLVAIGATVGTITAGLALLARRLLRRRSPSWLGLIAICVLAAGGFVAVGAALGQQDWTQACEARTVACEPRVAQ